MAKRTAQERRFCVGEEAQGATVPVCHCTHILSPEVIFPGNNYPPSKLYRPEEVDLNGNATMQGPVRVCMP